MLIIDADTILYQALTNAETEVEFEEDMWMLTCDHARARGQFNDRIEALMKEADTTEYVLCFSDTENFRKSIYPDYKSNRKKLRKPLGFKDFRSDMINDYYSISKPGLEADDCVGILATKPSNRDKCIIYSEDKDLMQIPGCHLKDGELIVVTPDEGEYQHMLQTLTGDAVDGYPGCPGIGKVKAERILTKANGEDIASYSLLWRAVVDTYTKAGLTEEDALVQARVAKILQFEDWDGKTQKPILWRPHD